MGYVELRCQICDVSMNLARLRNEDEPSEAGWGYSGSQYYSGDAGGCLVGPDISGCKEVSISELPNSLHIPGLGCTEAGGYHGTRITAKEMMNMVRARVLLPKPSNAHSEADAPAYEHGSRWFVTALTTNLPIDIEGDSYEFETQRYGINDADIMPWNMADMMEDFRSSDLHPGFVVHGPCWELFKKVSEALTGDIDLDGFCELWMRESCDNCGLRCLAPSHDEAANNEQWWAHLIGTEYLAADPFHIPQLYAAIVQEWYHSSREKREAAYYFRHGEDQKLNETDPFNAMPLELRHEILTKLSARDISSLRLASRAYRQLPSSVVKSKIKEVYPWFFEMDENAKVPLNGIRMFVSLEEGVEQLEIPWIKLGFLLRRLSRGILGVRNRVRVWKRCVRIINRIESLRQELLKDGINVPSNPLQVQTNSSQECSHCHAYDFTRFT